MSNGQKLWSRAKNVIPGGNMLLSKRPEMFLPNYWPTYFLNPRAVMFGILTVKNIQILLL